MIYTYYYFEKIYENISFQIGISVNITVINNRLRSIYRQLNLSWKSMKLNTVKIYIQNALDHPKQMHTYAISFFRLNFHSRDINY